MATPLIDLRVGNEWLRSRAAYGDVTLSWSWPGGCKEVSWRMSTKFGSRLPSLVRGALVEARWAGWASGSYKLQEPDWNGDEVTLTASGLVREGERFNAWADTTPSATTDVASTAVDTAITLGLQWVRASSVPTSSLATGTTDPVNSVTALLDAHAEKAGQRWGVDAFRNVYFAADPTTPAYYVTPGSGDLGIADDNYASHVILNHVSATDGAYRRAVYPGLTTTTTYSAKYGHAEFVRDITDKGPIADATADALAQSVYTQTKQRPGWTNGLALAHGEVRNQGGMPVHPLQVAADGFGKCFRLLGVRDEVTFTPYTDFVAGETSYTEGEDVVNVNPVGLVSRSQEDVLTELLEAMFPPEDTAA